MITFTDVDFDERSLATYQENFPELIILEEETTNKYCTYSHDPEIRAAIKSLDERKRLLNNIK